MESGNEDKLDAKPFDESKDIEDLSNPGDAEAIGAKTAAQEHSDGDGETESTRGSDEKSDTVQNPQEKTSERVGLRSSSMFKSFRLSRRLLNSAIPVANDSNRADDEHKTAFADDVDAHIQGNKNIVMSDSNLK